jgi:hypothetical protein
MKEGEAEGQTVAQRQTKGEQELMLNMAGGFQTFIVVSPNGGKDLRSR